MHLNICLYIIFVEFICAKIVPLRAGPPASFDVVVYFHGAWDRERLPR